MSKNILIFSDGTGQAGGLRPDQTLSNIYKLYRATRTGCDSKINPLSQVALYNAGLGSGDTDSILSSIRKLLSAATGLGIARNVADCYEEILKHYEHGDRIYLFGFSRGAYTSRNIAGVITLCGLPTTINNGTDSIPKFGRPLRAIAEEAVSIYRHGAGKESNVYEKEREELGRRFREKYSAYAIDGEGNKNPKKSNVAPYFIGLFDTVAALGVTAIQQVVILIGMAIVISAFSVGIGWLVNIILGWSSVLFSTISFSVTLFYFFISVLKKRIKFISSYPEKKKSNIYFSSDFPFINKNFGWHILSWHFKSYDKFLDNRTRYIRHALAIDEQRQNFSRLPWGNKGIKPYYDSDLEWFIQLWFSGNHSDIGGGYPELESRLADTTLSWMVEEINKTSLISAPVEIQTEKLNLFPDSKSMQHCEIYNLKNKYPSWWPEKLRLSWKRKVRAIPKDAPLHQSVLDRLEAKNVQQCEKVKRYQPESLKQHNATKKYY